MSSTPADEADAGTGDATNDGSSSGSRSGSDATTDRTSSDAGAPSATSGQSGIGRWRSREVEVPMRVYKTVTVFATLIAVVSVLGGFVLIDLATDRAQRPLSEVDAVVALLGIAAIVFGAVVYAFSTRFRATGMGKPNTGGGEEDDNG